MVLSWDAIKPYKRAFGKAKKIFAVCYRIQGQFKGLVSNELLPCQAESSNAQGKNLSGLGADLARSKAPGQLLCFKIDSFGVFIRNRIFLASFSTTVGRVPIELWQSAFDLARDGQKH